MSSFDTCKNENAGNGVGVAVRAMAFFDTAFPADDVVTAVVDADCGDNLVVEIGVQKIEWMIVSKHVGYVAELLGPLIERKVHNRFSELTYLPSIEGQGDSEKL